MPTASEFDRQLVVVTGAGSGIGAEVAREFAGRGARVVVVDSAANLAHAVAESIGATAVVTDVRDRAQVCSLMADLDQAPDILITSAGGAARRSALDVDEALFADSYQLNVGGFWRCTQEAARRAIAEQTSLKRREHRIQLISWPGNGPLSFRCGKRRKRHAGSMSCPGVGRSQHQS